MTTVRNMHAVAVGVNKYDNFRSLSFCVRDAAEMLAAITKRSTAVNSTLLADEDSGAVNSSEISKALKELEQANLTENDTAFFFFAGHGISVGGRDFLVPTDADPAKDEKKLISTDDVIASLTSSGAGTSVLAIDACRDEGQRSLALFGERTEEMARRRGSIVFFSCSPGEISTELGSLGKGHGVFSYCFIDALGEGLGTPLELDSFLLKAVTELCAANNLAAQHPYTTVAPVQKAVIDIFSGSVRSTRRPGNMILIAGPSNAGKTTLGRHLAANLRYTHVEMSSFAWTRYQDEVAYGGSLQDYLEETVWPSSGEDVLARDMLSAADGLQNVVVCGPRRAEEIDTIVGSGWNIIPIFLYANSLVRYERLRLAEEGGRYALNYKDFIKKDLKEYSWGLARIALMPRFELMISSGKVDAMQDEIVSQVGRFGVGKSTKG